MDLYWKWDDSLNIGVDVIDRQHQRIVDYMNQLHRAHVDNDRTRVEEVLRGLLDYTITHFAFEEDLMQQAGYPISSAHQRVHNSFIKRIKHLYQRHLNGEEVATKLLSDLRIWLTNHIRTDDQDY